MGTVKADMEALWADAEFVGDPKTLHIVTSKIGMPFRWRLRNIGTWAAVAHTVIYSSLLRQKNVRARAAASNSPMRACSEVHGLRGGGM